MPRATPLPPDERRAAIMAATEPLLVAHGRNVSTRQIAAAAGIAEGTLFRVFDSKDALIEAVVEEAFGVDDTCRRLAALDPDAPLEVRLVQAVAMLQESLRRVFSLFHSLAVGRDQRPDPARHAQHLEDNKRLEQALAQVFAPDAADLRLPPADVAALVKAVTFAASHPFLCNGRPGDPRQVADILLHGILLHGIAVSHEGVTAAC